MKIKTESACFDLDVALPSEIEHTGEPDETELPIIAVSHANEQIYMLVKKADIKYLYEKCK